MRHITRAALGAGILAVGLGAALATAPAAVVASPTTGAVIGARPAGGPATGAGTTTEAGGEAEIAEAGSPGMTADLLGSIPLGGSVSGGSPGDLADVRRAR
ncbi:hypothetical protein [Stackebrandtia soli]|uniref:hypothetical protein n=1 Tax=Stackebrandtia soli TaxID=1892856 RepID=UPI0039EB681A